MTFFPLAENVTTNASKRAFKKPTHVISRRSNPSSDRLMEGGSITEDGCKKTRKRASPKQKVTSPRITIKLPTKATMKKEENGPPLAEQKQKLPSKAKKIQGAQISHVHVKLKRNKEVVREAQDCAKGENDETLITKRRGRSANKITDSSVSEKSGGQHHDHQSGVNHKVACKLGSEIKVENVALSTDDVNLKQMERKLEDGPGNKLPNRRHRSSIRHSNDFGRSIKKQDQCIDGATESVFESSSLKDSNDQKVSVSKKKKSKRKKKCRKDAENAVTQVVGNAPSNIEHFQNGLDMGIPGLKLTRVRNTKSTSRKKRNKFVWTLTLVQGKSRANQLQEAENSNTANSSSDSIQKSTSPAKNLLPLSESPSDEVETRIEKSHEHQDEPPRQSEEVNYLSQDRETPGAFSCCTKEGEEISPSEHDELLCKEVVPPFQIKVVSTPGKCNSLKQSFSIHQVSQAQRDKELSTKDFSGTTDVTESCSPVPQVKQSSAASTIRKKRSRHKPWTTYKRKPKKSSEEQVNTSSPMESNCDPSLPTALEQENSHSGSPQQNSGQGELRHQLTDIEGTQNTELSEPSPSPYVPTEIKDEIVKQSPKDREVLMLEPSGSEDPEKKTHIVKMPQRHGKRRRRVLIGRRMKMQKPKVLQGKLAKCNDGSTVPSPTPVSKLIGVLKTKYRKRQICTSLHYLDTQRYKASLDATSKQREKVISGEGDDSVVDETLSDSMASQRGKSKCLKNIKHFIMPVVSARSSRVIKTPKRFMDDAGMSVLPRRNSPKKGHQFNLHTKLQKRNCEITGTESNSCQVKEEEQQEEEEEFTESKLIDDIDLIPPASQKELDSSSSKMPQNASPKIAGKRRSLLRDPSFKWQALGTVGEEVYTLDKNLEYDYEKFLDTEEFQTLINSDPYTLPLPIQEKETPQKLSKKMLNLKKSKRLKKINQGQKCRKGKKIKHNVIGDASPMLLDLDKIKQEECASRCSPDHSPSKSDKSKLKIEDLDTPGVVRKVSVSVRALSSKLLAMQYNSHEDAFEVNSHQENVLGE